MPVLSAGNLSGFKFFSPFCFWDVKANLNPSDRNYSKEIHRVYTKALHFSNFKIFHWDFHQNMFTVKKKKKCVYLKWSISHKQCVQKYVLPDKQAKLSSQGRSSEARGSGWVPQHVSLCSSAVGSQSQAQVHSRVFRKVFSAGNVNSQSFSVTAAASLRCD